METRNDGRFITLDETCDFLRAHDNYLILTHANPDGDTLGSAFGLSMLLERMGKRASVLCPDEIPEKFHYFTELANQRATRIQNTVIAVDVADRKLLGSLEEKYGDSVALCIDHHRSNTRYAAATYLDSDAAANCECIYALALALGLAVDSAVALALYTGISTDTGCFRFSNTTAKTLRIAADLMERRIDAAEINRIMFETKSRIRVELERLALDGMEFHFDGRCAVVAVTRKMIEATGCREDDLEGITSLSRCIEGVVVGVTLREKKGGGFKVSVRSYPPVDASEICSRLGGGGHLRAAGCQFDAGVPCEEAKKQILEQVKTALEESCAGTVTD